MATSLHQSGTAVVGYFATGDEAHRAINALIDAGFLPTEIGAAFHIGASQTGSGASHTSSGSSSIPSSGSEETRSPNVGGSLRSELGTTLPQTTTHGSRPSTSSAVSDTTPVQYASLGGGAGTPFDGASRPGPISGSDLTNTGLPTELKSELPHDSDVANRGSQSENIPSAAVAPVSAEHISVGLANRHEGWGEKLKHIFGGGHSAQAADVPTYGKDDLWAERKREAQDFGSGEGHLDLSTPRRYSQPAFERSFSSHGVQPEHARSLSQRIGHGGAIVTVHAANRAAEAESVMEANGGEVRMSAGTENAPVGDSNVEVYGTVGRAYTGYFD